MRLQLQLFINIQDRTFAGLGWQHFLRVQSLVKDVEHLSAQVEEQQRQRALRHGWLAAKTHCPAASSVHACSSVDAHFK